jgi:hypothetical protein
MAVKYHSEIIKIAEEIGIQDVKVDNGGRGHAKLIGRFGERSLRYPLSRSPSDRKVYVRIRTDLKRWAATGAV